MNVQCRNATTIVRRGVGYLWSVPTRVGVDAWIGAGVYRRYGRNLVARQREIEDIDILGQSDAVGRLRYRHQPKLDVPAQHDLPRRLVVLRGVGRQRVIVQEIGSRAKRPPGDRDDLLRAIVGALFGPRDAW